MAKMRRKGTLLNVGGKAVLYSHCAEQYGVSPEVDPEIPLLVIYPENPKTQMQKKMHPYVHSSTIYNSQDLETA